MLIYRNVDDMIGMSDWCIIIPIRDNNALKVRVYMRDKKALKGTYQKRYTYYVDRNDLKEIYSYESLGLAYNECIKYRKQRCKAFGQNDFEEGEYTIANVRYDMQKGGTENIFEMLTRFELARLKEIKEKDNNDKENEEQLEKTINERYDDWENLGYDY